jgi:hypothetical protein
MGEVRRVDGLFDKYASFDIRTSHIELRTSQIAHRTSLLPFFRIPAHGTTVENEPVKIN